MLRSFALLAGFVLVLLVVPMAAAQQQVTETRVEVMADGPQAIGPQGEDIKGLPRGESGATVLKMRFCWTGPGLNPQNAEVTAELELVSKPEWLAMGSPGEPQKWIPPRTELRQTEDCTSWLSWDPRVTIADNAEYDARGQVEIKWVVSHGDIGTYKDVAGDYPASFPVGVAAAPDDGLIPGVTSGPSPTPSVPTATNDSPGPVPAMAVLALFGLVALRRRL